MLFSEKYFRLSKQEGYIKYFELPNVPIIKWSEILTCLKITIIIIKEVTLISSEIFLSLSLGSFELFRVGYS